MESYLRLPRMLCRIRRTLSGVDAEKDRAGRESSLCHSLGAGSYYLSDQTKIKWRPLFLVTPSLVPSLSISCHSGRDR